jgi:hypothetical protein
MPSPTQLRGYDHQDRVIADGDEKDGGYIPLHSSTIPSKIYPTFSNKISILLNFSSTVWITVETEDSEAISRATQVAPREVRWSMGLEVGVREVAITVSPRDKARREMWWPNPEEAPGMNQTRGAIGDSGDWGIRTLARWTFGEDVYMNV